jgi:hypothetical protein
MKQKKRQRDDDCSRLQKQQTHHLTGISDDGACTRLDQQPVADVRHRSSWKWNDKSDGIVDFTGSDDVEIDDGSEAGDEGKGDEKLVGLSSPVGLCRPIPLQPPHSLCYGNYGNVVKL